MFEASHRLQQKKNRGQTLPPNAYNMDLGSSIRSNVSNFNSPAHEEKIEEEEDPNAGIELLECRENTNDTPEMEGNKFIFFHLLVFRLFLKPSFFNISKK